MAKKILIGLGALIAICLLVGFVLPHTVTVTRSTSINAPPERIYALVASPKQWPQWAAWNRRDVNMAITWSGPESGTGAAWSWVSKSEGDGTMKLLEATPSTGITYELRIPSMGGPSRGRFEFTPSGDATTVTWSMSATIGMGPIGGWFALLFPRMITPDFDSGLSSLKRLAEMPAAPEPTPPVADAPTREGAATSGALGSAPEPAPKAKR